MSVSLHNEAELPAWLNDILPENTEPALVTAEDGKFVISLGETREEFTDFREAVAALDANYGDYKLDATVVEATKEINVFDKFGIGLEEEDGMVRLVIGMNDEKRRKILSEGYSDFLEAAQNYEEDPNFVTAWNFIDRHPAFWTAHDIDAFPFSWNQSGHMSHVRIDVYNDDDGAPRVLIETGGHVEKADSANKAYSMHYGDWRLDVVGETYEDAVLQLAKRVALAFNPDGSDREDTKDLFEKIKPEWVRDLEERIDELHSNED